MNKNAVITDDWSNLESKALFEQHWPQQPELYEQYVDGGQCGGCSFFAPFDSTSDEIVLYPVILDYDCGFPVGGGKVLKIQDDQGKYLIFQRNNT